MKSVDCSGQRGLNIVRTINTNTYSSGPSDIKLTLGIISQMDSRLTAESRGKKSKHCFLLPSWQTSNNRHSNRPRAHTGQFQIYSRKANVREPCHCTCNTCSLGLTLHHFLTQAWLHRTGRPGSWETVGMASGWDSSERRLRKRPNTISVLNMGCVWDGPAASEWHCRTSASLWVKQY